ncbi:cyclic nucleotide-binding domain-containing protein [Melittangium boletus]|uniref:Cyclic nucleotide-binding domain-containing protein n=1 Tax=Melittangium boletus DSM 14713 TaxID=1294270 RepID=A0A250INV7_9BACT|nr:cyclic nucleotide-binding domain-containing protein [Melittangium boletus]ATB32912.1 hypothetical protein MEBOL_006401 [Melittangium boletus DSM 14713]
MPGVSNSVLVVPSHLSPEARERLTEDLYDVHRRIFDGVERESFARYVVESKATHTWILVHHDEAGRTVGYCAVHLFEKRFAGRPTAVVRMEAGLLRAFRGGHANVRFGLHMILRYLLRNPGQRMFYLGSLVHPSSYSVFTSYCGEVWPRRGTTTPGELLSFMDELAVEFGLERVESSNPLVRHVGWRTRETEMEREYWRCCDKLPVRYFIEANPGYSEGHGLVTLVPLTMTNLLGVLRSMGKRSVHQPFQAMLALAQRTSLGARLFRADVARRLRQSALFSHFDDASLLKLALRAEVVSLSGGQYVFHKGDTSDEMYLLVRGAAYVLMEDGAREKVVDELGHGSLFGEMAMLAGERRSASIQVATHSVLVRIRRSVLMPLWESNAHLRQGLWRMFTERRFDDLARGVARFRHLGRKERLALIHQGEHHELQVGETLALSPGSNLFVVSGVLELEQDGVWVATRGALLLEMTKASRVRANAATRLVVLPRRESVLHPLRAAG